MEKNKKRFLVFGVLAMFMFMFAMQFVVAGVNDKINDPKWLLDTVQFFNFGETWADMIVALAILLMIFAATFDILAFTAFESDWVKYAISAGIALVSAVVGLINYISVAMMSFAGGSVLFATIISIIIAAFFFVFGTFWKGKTKVWKAKTVANESEGGFLKAAAGIKGMAEITDAGAKAA